LSWSVFVMAENSGAKRVRETIDVADDESHDDTSRPAKMPKVYAKKLGHAAWKRAHRLQKTVAGLQYEASSTPSVLDMFASQQKKSKDSAKPVESSSAQTTTQLIAASQLAETLLTQTPQSTGVSKSSGAKAFDKAWLIGHEDWLVFSLDLRTATCTACTKARPCSSWAKGVTNHREKAILDHEESSAHRAAVLQLGHGNAVILARGQDQRIFSAFESSFQIIYTQAKEQVSSAGLFVSHHVHAVAACEQKIRTLDVPRQAIEL
jgi:hypothetical protein